MGGRQFPYDGVIVKTAVLKGAVVKTAVVKTAVVRTALCGLCCAVMMSGCHVAAWSINSPLAPSAAPATPAPQGSSQSASATIGADNLLNVLMLGVILSQTVGGGGPSSENRPALSDDLRIRKTEPDASRRVSEQDCTRPVRLDEGNLKCR